MRIHSVTVRNYRLHRELKVDLDPSRTLIGGPNESGKSTLVEAIHRGLFLRSRVTGDVQKSMVPDSHAGSPEVELRFAVGASEFRLSKRFNGANGTTTLTEAGRATLVGEEAETRLAALLRVEPTGGGKGVGDRVAQQWSHLWVWQGQSGQDPTEHAKSQHASLVQHLQQEGVEGAFQSMLDGRVAASFAEAKNRIYTQTGEARKGSDLYNVQAAVKDAQAVHQRAIERVQKLRQAVEDFEDSTKTLACVAVDLAKLEADSKAVTEKLARLQELEAKKDSQQHAFNAAAEKFGLLKKADAQIAEMRGKIKSLQQTLAPKAGQTLHLTAARDVAKKAADTAAATYDAATDRTRVVRLRRDLFAACVARFEKAARLAEISARADQAEGCQAERDKLISELARLPELDAAGLRKLQKLDLDLSNSEAALRAMAAGIEVLEAHEPVKLGGAALTAGQSQIVTEDTELVAGTTLRLRIRPGGGTTLAETKQNVKDARNALSKALDARGLASVAAAAAVLAAREDLKERIKLAETAMKGLGADTLPAALAEAKKADIAAQAEVDRRAVQLPDLKLPLDLALARDQLAAEIEALARAESEERKSRKTRDDSAEAYTLAETALTRHLASIKSEEQQRDDLHAQLQLLIQNHGDDAARGATLAHALHAQDEAELRLNRTLQEIAALQPELLKQDSERLQRALKEKENARQEADVKRQCALHELRSEGDEDPEAALDMADARLRSAQEHLVSVRRKAEAIRLLDELFAAEQRAQAARFVRPLAERISGYLECLFGPGVRAIATLAHDGLTGLQLVRPGDGEAAMAFSTLSFGAREQFAAAVRLAMAEILAAGHDGCLPVVFDDAFAYADPERVRTLQRMLDLAATRGLQVIVLTCNPSDYAALGAREILLRPPRAQEVVPASIPHAIGA